MKEVISALIEVQKEIKNLPASESNPFYNSKYVPLNDILDFIRPLLVKNKLFLTQSVKEIENNYFRLETILIHESGEQLTSSVIVPAGHDPQKQGSALTYARRYGLSAFFAIATEHDDDANSTIDEPKQSRLDFKDIESKTENMNIDQLNEYSKQISKQFPGLTDKQKEWLKHHFANRRRSIDQSFNNQNSIDGMFGGDK